MKFKSNKQDVLTFEISYLYTHSFNLFAHELSKKAYFHMYTRFRFKHTYTTHIPHSHTHEKHATLLKEVLIFMVSFTLQNLFVKLTLSSHLKSFS